MNLNIYEGFERSGCQRQTAMWEWHTGDFSTSISSNNEYDLCIAKVVLPDLSAYLYQPDSEDVCLVIREQDFFETQRKYLPSLFTVQNSLRKVLNLFLEKVSFQCYLRFAFFWYYEFMCFYYFTLSYNYGYWPVQKINKYNMGIQ